MSEILEKLPRFIPEKDKFHLTRHEAIERFTENNRKGYIGTIWFGPFPYINNLCSCSTPECAGIRPRLDFDIFSIYKAEYVIQMDREKCPDCLMCVSKCPFKALTFDRSAKKVRLDISKCYGCGVCRHFCPDDALYLVPRDTIPEVCGKY